MTGTSHCGFNTRQHDVKWLYKVRMMQKSIETRWFFQGTAPPEVVQWFSTALAMVQTPRVDTYLHTPGTPDLGIKLREGRIEIKQRVKQLGSHTFHPHVTGVAESWNKWGFPINSVDTAVGMEPTAWIPVVKERTLRQYQIISAGRIRAIPAWLFPLQRSSIELTNILLNDTPWWSLGFEAIGTDIDLFTPLQTTAALAFKASGFPPLSAEHSYSYPKWIDMNYVSP